MAHRHPHGHRLEPRLQASVWSFVATWARDNNTNSSCARTMYTEMALGSRTGQDVTMTLGGSTGHSDLHSPHGSVAPEHQYGSWLLLLASAWPLMVSGAMDINTDPATGPWTQTWSSAAAFIQMIPWPQVTALFIQISLASAVT